MDEQGRDFYDGEVEYEYEYEYEYGNFYDGARAADVITMCQTEIRT